MPPAAPNPPTRCPAAPPKLACPANAAIVQQLVELRLRVQRKMPGSRYYYTVQRALESVSKHNQPIRTYQELVAVKFMGPSIAKNIQLEGEATETGGEAVEGGDEMAKDTNKKKKANNSNKATKKKKADAVNQLFVVHPAPPPSIPQPSAATATAAPQAADARNAGRKEALYEQAVRDAQRWKDVVAHQNQTLQKKLRWRLVLLIDIREQWCEYMQAQCTMSGIPCESRALPIGDMMWIVQGFCKNKSDEEEVLLELVCGTILERKTPEDLKSSIFGSRYMEQRLRLQNSGIPQIVYLIEGDSSKDLYACSMDTLHTAIWETRLLMDFRILHTAHADDTVQTLKRLHRRILQRTFPRTFQRTEILPHFRASLGHQPKKSAASTDRNGRHRRERRQSLANLTFDVDPVEPLGMPRFISYPELKAKILLDRERGTQSIQHLHLAMLKQVPTWYAKKCLALAAVYPTVHSLCAALAAASANSSNGNAVINPYQPKKEHLVAQIPLTATATQTATTRTIGTRSSEELYICYTGGSDEITSTPQGSSPSASVPVARSVAAPMTSMAAAVNPNPSPAIFTMNSDDDDDDSCHYNRENEMPQSGMLSRKDPTTSSPPEIWCVDSDEEEPSKPAARTVYRTSPDLREEEKVYTSSFWEYETVPSGHPAPAMPYVHRQRPTAFSQDVIELLSD